MENYDKQITSEATKCPKNKKKIILISVIAAVVVLLILLSSLIPALVLNAKIESLMEAKETSDLDYFEFTPNENFTAYHAVIKRRLILPEVLVVPGTYLDMPVEFFRSTTELNNSTDPSAPENQKSWLKNLRKIVLNEGIKDCSVILCPNLEELTLPKSLESLSAHPMNGRLKVPSIWGCQNLKTVYYYKNTAIENIIFSNNPNAEFIVRK